MRKSDVERHATPTRSTKAIPATAVEPELGQVTEVKNKLDKRDTEQIADMVDYTGGKGYAPILVTAPPSHQMSRSSSTKARSR